MKRWAFLSTLFLALAIATLWTGWNGFLDKPGELERPVVVAVPAGSSTARIAEILAYEGVTGSTVWDMYAFRLAVRALGVTRHLQAGEYAFEPGVSLRQVMEKLKSGRVVQHKITFPEGLTTTEVVARLMAEEILEGPVFHIDEGKLLPETYAFTRGESRMNVARRMEAAMETILAEAWAARDPELPLQSPEELLTLASIVEKEAGVEEERPLVAAVYLNRLKKGMRLQADPTVIYGAAGFNGDITSEHLREDHPYNTYTRKGLPPGPICNPGRASLMAVARPAQSDYLYFVADGNGGHFFSRTLEEHQKNVRRYLEDYNKKYKNK